MKHSVPLQIRIIYVQLLLLGNWRLNSLLSKLSQSCGSNDRNCSTRQNMRHHLGFQSKLQQTWVDDRGRDNEMIIKACSSVLSSMKTSIELTRHFVSFEQKAADELINSRTVSVETFLSLETKRLNSREKKLLSIEILPQSKFFVIQNRFIIPVCLPF